MCAGREGGRELRLPTPLPNPFGNPISFPPLLLPSPSHSPVLPRLCRQRRAPEGGREAARRGEAPARTKRAPAPAGRPPRLPSPGTAPPRPCPARRLPALPDLPPLPPGAAPSGAPPPAPLLPSRQLHGRGGRRPLQPAVPAGRCPCGEAGPARGSLFRASAAPAPQKPCGPGRFPPGQPRRSSALPAGRGGRGPRRLRPRRLRPGRTRRGGWRRPARRGGSGDAAGQGAQSLLPRPREKELAKAAPFLVSPSARAGAALRERGTSTPARDRPARGRNGALCPPVKAPALPELREKVFTIQKTSLFHDLLSSTPAASYPALKACWKHGAAVCLGCREHLFQDFHRRS